MISTFSDLAMTLPLDQTQTSLELQVSPTSLQCK